LDHPGRVTGDYGSCGHIAGDHGASADDSTLSNGYPRQDDRAGTYENIVTHADTATQGSTGGKMNPVTQHAFVIYGSAVIDNACFTQT
jgi:hypothetical protein